ncbi:MAG: RtcB family protein [bacterium]|nr:RtcB family protein [bacterium]
MEQEKLKHIKQVAPAIWEIPKSAKKGMLVPARIVATKKLLSEMDNGVWEQVTNVACLPGIVNYAYCMPDGHWGYGFPIGGVAAFDPEAGVISPGGIGFDINCGMRLLVTDLKVSEVLPKLPQLVDLLFERIPSGVGSRGFVKLGRRELETVMTEGARWCLKRDLAWEEDIEKIEEKGKILGADPSKVSQRAKDRGIGQLGTLGSGNHYLEIQKVAQIFDPPSALRLGINSTDQVTIMIHCGSRGLGHQVGTDYLRTFVDAMEKYNIEVPDRQLACAPFKSKEGKDYYAAMACAANMAFVNRQIISHRVRECFTQVLGKTAEQLGMKLVYDVCHNIAKVEEHKWRIANGKWRMEKVLVHRKGATRSFPNQPVILGGSMETGSYLLVGTEKALEVTFGSTAHGSGRTMSRVKAQKMVRGQDLQKKMQEEGIYVRTASYSGLAEEAGFAYKDISEVVEALEEAGISQKIASFTPIGNIKG